MEEVEVVAAEADCSRAIAAAVPESEEVIEEVIEEGVEEGANSAGGCRHDGVERRVEDGVTT